MDNFEIDLPQIIEHDKQCVKVVLVPRTTEKINYFELSDYVSSLVRKFKLCDYEGVEYYCDLDGHISGIRGHEMCAVNFLSQSSALRFNLIINNIPNAKYTIGDSSSFPSLARYNPIRKL